MRLLRHSGQGPRAARWVAHRLVDWGALPLLPGALLLLSGCAGVVSHNSTTSPPPSTYTLSGSITPASAGSGATVRLSGATTASTTADSSGNFSFTGLANGTYVVTPSRSGFSFNPTQQSVTVNGANAAGVSFTGTQQTSTTYTLSGSITPASAGSGATVSLSGPSTASTTADTSGNFSFSSLANGTYVVTPSRSGYTFSPAQQSVTVNGANVTGVSFTATQQTAHSVGLSWNASTSSVSGYNVYRGTTNGGPYTKMNSSLITGLTFTDTAVSSGSTYYYVTTAVDSSGEESTYSNQATAKIP